MLKSYVVVFLASHLHRLIIGDVADGVNGYVLLPLLPQVNAIVAGN